MGIAAVASAVGIAASAASAANSINNLVSSGGGGVSGAGQPSGSNDASNPIYGVHVSSQPMKGQEAPKPTVMQPAKVVQGQATNPKSVPTQGAEMNANSAKTDFNNVWASRLSKYLDYNSRGLG